MFSEKEDWDKEVLKEVGSLTSLTATVTGRDVISPFSSVTVKVRE
jgi:hypothetical protein